MAHDPWDEAADAYNQLTTKQQAEAVAAERRRQAETAEAAAQRRREDAERAKLQAAIDKEAQKLAGVLRTRGDKAQRMLTSASAQSGRDEHVSFGSRYQGGGSHVAVVFTKDGLQYVSGRGSSWSVKESTRPGTAKPGSIRCSPLSEVEA